MFNVLNSFIQSQIFIEFSGRYQDYRTTDLVPALMKLAVDGEDRE